MPTLAQDSTIVILVDSLTSVTSVRLRLDPEQRKFYYDCLYHKYTQAAGQINNTKAKQRTQQLPDLDRSCLQGISLAFKWTPKNTEYLQRYFYSKHMLQDLPADKSRMLVDCLVEKLKADYPEGLNRLLAEQSQQIMRICRESLKKVNNLA